jgi:uncharacterized protein (DUF488 family)
MTRIFTIGHSVVGVKPFIEKLQEHHIDVLVDVRTKPYSSRSSQFNREVLESALKNKSIKYWYKGRNLGGLGENINFNEAIDEVISIAESNNVALMCSEGNYHKCHRYLILTPAFESRGNIVEHISWKDWKEDIQQKLF